MSIEFVIDNSINYSTHFSLWNFSHNEMNLSFCFNITAPTRIIIDVIWILTKVIRIDFYKNIVFIKLKDILLILNLIVALLLIYGHFVKHFWLLTTKTIFLRQITYKHKKGPDSLSAVWQLEQHLLLNKNIIKGKGPYHPSLYVSIKNESSFISFRIFKFIPILNPPDKSVGWITQCNCEYTRLGC